MITFMCCKSNVFILMSSPRWDGRESVERVGQRKAHKEMHKQRDGGIEGAGKERGSEKKVLASYFSFSRVFGNTSKADDIWLMV